MGLLCKIFRHKWQYESEHKRMCPRCRTCQKLIRKVVMGAGKSTTEWVPDKEFQDLIDTLDKFCQ